MSRLWVDVGDLFGYAGLFRRPSGIQRVVYEVGQALAALDPDGTRIGFVRGGEQGRFVPVAWSKIAAMFGALAAESSIGPEPLLRMTDLGRAMALQLDAWRALLQVPRSVRPDRWAQTERADVGADVQGMAAGDTLLVAGAGWSDPGHTARVAAVRERTGIRVALLVHDIIPLRRPEWFDPVAVARFGGWLDGMLALSDRLLAVSQSTARDVTDYRRMRGMTDCAVSVVRLGDGFSEPGGGSVVPTASAVQGLGQSYALFVSTIEIRKNHALLVEAWRALLERLGPDRVPNLVFAGREGALTGDLMRQLRASDHLGGKVVLRHAASDGDIAALYRDCAFTLFPSLYEGWGLPVAESLAFGRPCLAACATSIPEVGGDLARYFDPLDLGGTVRAIEAVLRDPEGLAAWQRQIVAEFRPAPWSRTAEMILAGVA